MGYKLPLAVSSQPRGFTMRKALARLATSVAIAGGAKEW